MISLKQKVLIKCIGFLVNRLDERAQDTLVRYLLHIMGYNVIITDNIDQLGEANEDSKDSYH